ncbi:uncharacterized protein BO66DRAFT_396747 [Aspergillus aculeatinus CBS 121060]|uniref:Uncharacterized protein n=1 Tax=Aspergillus aculeatinus CBS 121060 TaxID=1448322 RepID=A0ACD1GRI6_9EURO|nr:hypothetical protein BO66DRAFT_396747 [Aspergillus aculeatinus CBS 121060]RAH63747.1 hypothetical protein BO66DRAFT_396747 [Aspergillus aculeatinus CBS 121060]
MQLKSLLVALALGLSIQAYEIKGYTEKDCKGDADGSSTDGTNLEECGTLASSKWKSIKATPGDLVLTAYKSAKCAGEGYALQPGKCVNGEFTSYEAQWISTMRKRNTTEIIGDWEVEDEEAEPNTSL